MSAGLSVTPASSAVTTHKCLAFPDLTAVFRTSPEGLLCLELLPTDPHHGSWIGGIGGIGGSGFPARSMSISALDPYTIKMPRCRLLSC